MLGQLLHSFNPTRRASRVQVPLESVTEDAHTHSLLFPDAVPSHHSDSLNIPIINTPPNGATSLLPGSDCTQGDIDLESPRDIRFLIAQDAAGSQDKVILFDSKPVTAGGDSPTLKTKRLSGGFDHPRASSPVMNRSHSRKSSATSESAGRRSPGGLGSTSLHRGRFRTTSISSMPNIDENAPSRSRESEEMAKSALECMFENTTMAYKGPSFRMHIVPLVLKPNDQILTSPTVVDGSGSFGRAEGRRRSHLAKSYTPANPPAELNRPGSSRLEYAGREGRRRTVMVTRTFSVALPEEDEVPDSASDNTSTPHGSLGNANEFPFPASRAAGKKAVPRIRGRSKQPRLPMYAITMIIHLPVATSTDALPLS